MNIRDLEYFQRLAYEKSFSKVATFYKVSQPTITYAIKRLESEFAAPLINRSQSHKNISLTPAGRQLTVHINNILREIRLAKQEMSHFSTEQIPLGLPPIIGNHYFQKMSPLLLAEDLLPHLEIKREGSESLLRKIKQGQIDVGLLGSVDSIREDSLAVEVLATQKFKIVVAPEHPLAQKKAVNFADLAQEKFLLLGEQYVHHHAFERLRQASKIDPEVIYQSDDLEILKGMLKAGMGISFLAEIAIETSDQLISLDLLDEPQPHFLISMIHRANSITTPLMADLLQVMRQVIKDN